MAWHVYFPCHDCPDLINKFELFLLGILWSQLLGSLTPESELLSIATSASVHIIVKNAMRTVKNERTKQHLTLNYILIYVFKRPEFCLRGYEVFKLMLLDIQISNATCIKKATCTNVR